MLMGALIGGAVAFAVILMNQRKAKTGTGLPGAIEALLRGSATPLTLKQISERVGKDSFMGRGQVAQAIAALHGTGKIKTNPAPAGTPQLRKVEVITYEIASPAAN